MEVVTKLIRSNTTIGNGISVTVIVPIPDVQSNPEQALAMGRSISEKEENIAKFAGELLIPQGTNAVKKMVREYLRKEALPERLIRGQNITVCPMPAFMAAYIPSEDQMYMDNDAAIGLYGDEMYILGYLVGRKLTEVKQVQPEEICRILGYHTELASFFFAYEAGTLLGIHSLYEKVAPAIIEDRKRRAIRQYIQQLAWN